MNDGKQIAIPEFRAQSSGLSTLGLNALHLEVERFLKSKREDLNVQRAGRLYSLLAWV